MLKDNKSLKKRKKALKHRFQVELYPGAKLFYLSGKILFSSEAFILMSFIALDKSNFR